MCLVQTLYSHLIHKGGFFEGILYMVHVVLKIYQQSYMYTIYISQHHTLFQWHVHKIRANLLPN